MIDILLWTAGAIGTAALAAEGLRRAPLRVGATVFSLLSVVGVPVGLVMGASAFMIVKCVSMCLATAYIFGMRQSDWLERPAWQRIGFAILAINIVEAVGTAIYNGQWEVALAGVLLVITQAAPSTIHIDTRSARRDLKYPLGWGWIAAYTVWNLAFVYPFQGGSAIGFGLAHLIAPLILCWGRSTRWIEYRTFVLTVLMLVFVGAADVVPGGHALYHPTIERVLAIGAVVIALAVTAYSAMSPGAPPTLVGRLAGKPRVERDFG